MRYYTVVALLFSSLFFVAGAAFAAVEVEPNDDSGSATPLDALTPMTGTQTADDDWFVINVPAGAEHVIIDLTFVDDEGNADLELYDATATGLPEDASFSDTDNEFIDTNSLTAPGTNYIRVFGGAPGGNLGNTYTLTWASFVPGAEDGFEDNDDGLNATALAENALVFAVLLDDDDWFSIDVQPGSERVEILLKHERGPPFNSDGADIDFELQDSDGNLIQSSETTPDTANEIVVATDLSAGSYRIRVTEATNTLANGYSLTWDDTTPIPAAPANLAANAADAEVVLSWDPVPNAASYTVYWNTAGGVTTGDNAIDAGSNSTILHSGLANGTPYYYRVLATNAGGSSDLSVEASATPAAAVLSNSAPVVGDSGGGALSPFSLVILMVLSRIVRRSLSGRLPSANG